MEEVGGARGNYHFYHCHHQDSSPNQLMAAVIEGCCCSSASFSLFDLKEEERVSSRSRSPPSSSSSVSGGTPKNLEPSSAKLGGFDDGDTVVVAVTPLDLPPPLPFLLPLLLFAAFGLASVCSDLRGGPSSSSSSSGSSPIRLSTCPGLYINGEQCPAVILITTATTTSLLLLGFFSSQFDARSRAGQRDLSELIMDTAAVVV
ncbi:hypothetical protein TYRP_003755 [Tyrophagus putrescentiae]|nr:hypothetical protein TYRP_003755 [Tyrophagus putrescentiae]